MVLPLLILCNLITNEDVSHTREREREREIQDKIHTPSPLDGVPYVVFKRCPTTVADWLEWSGMAAKIPKCQCISLKGSTGKLVDPRLCLHCEVIPFTTDPVCFLGLNVQAPSHNTSSQPAIISKLDEMLTAVDTALLTRAQKLLMYTAAICPRLAWSFMTQELPTSLVEKELDWPLKVIQLGHPPSVTFSGWAQPTQALYSLPKAAGVQVSERGG